MRIILTWYPQINLKNGFWLLFYLPTEIFLTITKKIVGPIGGVDITPVIWFGLISLSRELLVGPQGIISQMLLKQAMQG
ncbi:YggT family protein [Prochlorococcus sp. SS52]|nr:YggT family protein [Prochlorococcus marinus str. SS2]KGG36565.1 YggT family protein [Prochlorococcus sp. SS52]